MKQQPGWVLPDLRAASRRTHTASVIEKSLFSIPDECRNMGKGRRYYVRTYGCQANERDSETLAGILEALGYAPAKGEEDADVILINTCAVRRNAEDKVLGELGSLKRLSVQRDDLIIGLCGCMAQEEEMVNIILEKYRHVNLIFGTHNLHRLPQLLHAAIEGNERCVEVFSQEGEVIENLPVRRFGRYKAWVNIMYGCDKFCTYCIVPYTRGKERSRAMEDILQELRELKAQGYREVTLLGQNVNAYGKDLGIEGGFAALLRESAKTGIDRIRFTTSHPWDFSDEMIGAIASCDNIMPFIHLPVQSGDSDVLRRMGRRYTIEQYRSLFDRIKAAIPGCAVSTDIIVGFPNESDEQFAHTMDIVDYCRFDNAYTFIYSPREGTPAARMADSVPMEVKQERLARLNERWNAYALENNQAYVGRIVKVLVDGPSKKDEHIYSGYTETNKMVNFTADKVQAGEIIEVKITQARTWSLNGEAI
ncbi:MAG TPA: tRNA (N6-isopentenyl adenosine(37)-C2)-methylthiotransferase MiaB [Candidatus Merdibacter merdavium]|uniref:tRNA-2-methylthio-N(6)-dimethylallyladenosine synthase n=1 Tax=Candidatus Merdibacter merdavium TaxID=2838692 RepID=A0A9D2NRI8_9FIRM|nr:tRNA (N6-isopentenyl adenosine(37)-C2)-methylthiotransferase MiaB [Candidatus Merdibacter merdavium]